MSRFGDIAIGILVGATGLAGLSYLCSDDFKGFGNSDDDDDYDEKVTLAPPENKAEREENCDEDDSTEIDEDFDVEDAESA